MGKICSIVFFILILNVITTPSTSQRQYPQHRRRVSRPFAAHQPARYNKEPPTPATATAGFQPQRAAKNQDYQQPQRLRNRRRRKPAAAVARPPLSAGAFQRERPGVRRRQPAAAAVPFREAPPLGGWRRKDSGVIEERGSLVEEPPTHTSLKTKTKKKKTTMPTSSQKEKSSRPTHTTPHSLEGWLSEPTEAPKVERRRPSKGQGSGNRQKRPPSKQEREKVCGHAVGFGISCKGRMDQCLEDEHCPGSTRCCLVGDCGYLCIMPAKSKEVDDEEAKEQWSGASNVLRRQKEAEKEGVEVSTTSTGLKVDDITRDDRGVFLGIA